MSAGSDKARGHLLPRLCCLTPETGHPAPGRGPARSVRLPLGCGLPYAVYSESRVHPSSTTLAKEERVRLRPHQIFFKK